MHACLPIIGTNIGAVPDFLQHNWNGILVEPDDIDGIANGIIKLLDQPDLCRLYGERNFQITNERYSWQAATQKLYFHINKYLNSHINTDKLQ